MLNVASSAKFDTVILIKLLLVEMGMGGNKN